MKSVWWQSQSGNRSRKNSQIVAQTGLQGKLFHNEPFFDRQQHFARTQSWNGMERKRDGIMNSFLQIGQQQPQPHLHTAKIIPLSFDHQLSSSTIETYLVIMVVEFT